MNRHANERAQQRIRKLEVVLAVSALFFYLLCFVTTASAEAPRAVAAIGPVGNRSVTITPEDRHGDYLKDVVAIPLESKSLNSAIFDKPVADEMSEKFNAFNREYEAREPYRLNEREHYMRYEQANKDLAEWTLKKLLQYHFEHTLKDNLESSVKRAARESRSASDQSAAKAVVAISELHKAIRSTTFNLGPETKTRFKYDFPSGLMRLGMTSPLVDANMDYHTKSVNQTIGTVGQPEKLSLGMSKNLEFASASTGLSYGLLNETLNYGVNKRLAGPLSCQVDQAHNMRDTSKDETMFRVNFGTRF